MLWLNNYVWQGQTYQHSSLFLSSLSTYIHNFFVCMHLDVDGMQKWKLQIPLMLGLDAFSFKQQKEASPLHYFLYIFNIWNAGYDTNEKACFKKPIILNSIQTFNLDKFLPHEKSNVCIHIKCRKKLVFGCIGFPPFPL